MNSPADSWEKDAEQALSSLWRTQISRTTTESLREEGRNGVYRRAIAGGPVPTVILKASVGDDQNPYTPGDDLPNRPFHRFCNEWAGCQMLGPLGLGPIAYAGDIQRGFYLMQDLGSGRSLAEDLTADDPQAAEATLFAYARTLG